MTHNMSIYNNNNNAIFHT